MARFTNIGMGRKTFVASAAEEAQKPKADETTAGPSSKESGDKKGKKRSRDDKDKGTGGWKRDPEIARMSSLPFMECIKTDEIGQTRDNSIKSAERRINRQNLNTSSTTCFACRGVGHAARDCPNVLLAAQGIDNNGTAALLEGEEGKGNKMKRGKGRNGGEVTGGKCYR
jgi:zinc finger CCHC domain-containing protein 9